MENNYDPREEDFDAYACWEAGCYEVYEDCFGDPNDEDFTETFYCGAAEDFKCPLLSSV